jgi:hypothetical protein
VANVAQYPFYLANRNTTHFISYASWGTGKGVIAGYNSNNTVNINLPFINNESTRLGYNASTNILYANVLFHEVLYHGVLGATDDPFAPVDTFSSTVQNSQTLMTVTNAEITRVEQKFK